MRYARPDRILGGEPPTTFPVAWIFTCDACGNDVEGGWADGRAKLCTICWRQGIRGARLEGLA